MNPTKNVKYIEVKEELFTQLCEGKFDEKVVQLQNRYRELEKDLSGKLTRWMKLRDKDCYLDTVNKVLFPDTRKMKLTDLRAYKSDSYDAVLEYIAGCGEDKLSALRKKAEQENVVLPSKCEAEIAGFSAGWMDIKQARAILKDGSCPCKSAEGYLKAMDGKASPFVTVLFPGSPLYDLARDTVVKCRDVSFALNISVHQFPNSDTPFELLVKYGLYPAKFEEKENEAIAAFHKIVKSGIDINDFDELKRYLKKGDTTNIMDIDLRMEAIEHDVETEEIDLASDTGMGAFLRQYFDECDYIRARIQKYSAAWYLSDEGGGHWELWGEPEKQKTDKPSNGNETTDENMAVTARKMVLRLKNGVIARNPAADVKHDAVVGIDFGTKSTIVALQDGGDQIIPLRVGMADYSVAPEISHFENPTVMQFVDLSRFVRQYHKSAGRPMTSWDDLLISHEAFENLIGAENSNEIASFVSDIKQWAGGQYRNGDRGHLIIRDAKGYRYDIENYMALTEEDIDLVEIYAYYIGLFINNMHTGIHLDYMLSFPETFSKEIKEHILHSFTKGIRKSIPSIVFEDEGCAAAFRVRQGPSEPAAYAACALEQYGIEPTDQGVFYGIFDFGGGTTDYDYGIWKNAPEDEYTYNYVIKHYGSGGDKTLGGENILQLLSYNVFSDDTVLENGESNLDIMRKNKLTYYRPEEGKIHSGTEALNNSGESAMLNTKLMMEALRPIWEEWSEVREWIAGENSKHGFELQAGAKNVSIILGDDSTVKAKLSLCSDQGRKEVVLNVDMAMVNKTINDRIESGVRNFFEGLVRAYRKPDQANGPQIHLFLAGNSSKSRRVMRLFEDYIVEYNERIFGETVAEKTSEPRDEEREKDDEISYLNSLERSHFILYPPLGTETARKIQESRNIDIETNSLMAPTGKTGVAFGLVMCREGSMIKVEPETQKSEQIKLNYYIGVNFRKNFKLIFDRNTGYGKWMKFSRIAAETETFEFYYSELPEVVGNNIPIKGNKSVYMHKCLVDHVVADAFIFFKFTSPTQLEYVAAMEDKVELGEYLSKIYKVDL